MFINKVNGISNVGFKSYQHVKNNVGETVMRFNYPYDHTKEDCEVLIYKVKPTEDYNFKLNETPIAKVQLKPEGVDVNLQSLTNLGKEEAFAYKIVRKDKKTGEVIWEGADTGTKMRRLDNGDYGFRLHQDVDWVGKTKDNNGKDIPGHETLAGPAMSEYKYTLVTRKGTTPRVQGAAYLAIPDSFYPGAKYHGFNEENTGEIYIDNEHQKNMENTIRNFSNKFGGNLAGLEAKIPYLKQNGYKMLFTTPIANGDNVSSHSYWNKNNMQIAPTMGTLENHRSFMRELYKNGMGYVFDGTFTSEGLEGIHLQYALRWAEKNPQTYYWFRMNGIKNSNLGLGTVPANKEVLSHRIVNAPFNYELQSDGTYKAVANPLYDKNKETYVQIYDKTQASKSQLDELDKPIKAYQQLRAGQNLDKITYDDTLINYVCQIDPKEYQNRVKVINDLNKNFGKKIDLYSPEGTITACQFSNFKFSRDTIGNVTWDANKDMVKMNYHISGYDENLLQAIPDKSQRDYERQMIIRGTKEVQDMTLQSLKYWTQNSKDIQTIYTAQTVGKAKTLDALNNLIKENKLPEETRLNPTMLNNILNGFYMFAPKGIMDKDDVTVQALMKMPLDAVEFGENTAGVLSTSYFSNRATNDENIGVSRFDLMKQNNPHLVEPYKETYGKVNALFQNEIKDFADAIIAKVNEKSDEKLLDKDGEYTEYGEYVIDLIGKDITRYALLKALGGESFKAKTLKNGEITYDYENIRKNTTLKSLGINAHNPSEEARLLEKKMENGLKKLSDKDVSFVADSITKTIQGTDTSSFRIAEAMVDKAALGLNWRLDAAKDVMDMDAIRNQDNDFDDNMDEMFKFWKNGVQAIKEVNPNSSIVAEITDIEQLMRDKYGYNGEDCYPYNGKTDIGTKFNGVPDFMTKLFNETGITSEAAYSYFFTDLLTAFAKDFEAGYDKSRWLEDFEYNRHDTFRDKIMLLTETRSPDFMRNFYTFMANHDKPRMIHGMTLDMQLFHNTGNKLQNKLDALQVLSNSKSFADMPIEVKLNAENTDYTRTISWKAIAMSKLLKQVVNEDLKDIATENDIKNINKAIVDLTNGNYLNNSENVNYQTIKIKELSSVEEAFKEILKNAEKYGLKLSEQEKATLIKKICDVANNKNVSDYLVKGDLSSETNINYAKQILGEQTDYSSYNLYTIQLARLIRDSINNRNSAFDSALKDFVKKYNNDVVNKDRTELPKTEPSKVSMKKDGYAVTDIRSAMEMVIKQVEYKTGKPVQNREKIIDTVFKSATEPAVTKAAMIMEFLGSIFGNSQMYAGDELGMTGYEEKAKNIYLQNRNALPWSDLEEDNIIGNYRNAIMNTMNSSISNKSKPDLHPLCDGTPYLIDVKSHGKNRNEIIQRIIDISKELKNENVKDKSALEQERRELTKDLAKVAYLMQSGNGDMTVSVFYAGDIDTNSRVDYFAKNGIVTEEDRKKFFEDNNIESINPHNKYVPIQEKTELDSILIGGSALAIPAGTVFMNANVKDKARYIVNELGAIVKEGGGKIVLDGKTARNGVMVLKKLAFRGRKPIYDKQFNFASLPYKTNKTIEEGKNLSIIAK